MEEDIFDSGETGWEKRNCDKICLWWPFRKDQTSSSMWWRPNFFACLDQCWLNGTIRSRLIQVFWHTHTHTTPKEIDFRWQFWKNLFKAIHQNQYYLSPSSSSLSISFLRALISYQLKTIQNWYFRWLSFKSQNI